MIGSVLSAVDLVLGNISATKHLTLVTYSMTVGCRSARYYCKKYDTFWDFTLAVGQKVAKALKFTIKQ
jgi:hypothetical protein